MNLRNLALFCLLVIFSILGFSASAIAADTGGLRDGLYYDVTHPGTGVDVRTFGDDGVFLAVYVSRTNIYGDPTWFTAQGSVDDTSFDLLATTAVLIDPGPQVLIVAGSLVVLPNADGSIDAVVEIRDVDGFSPPFAPIFADLHLVRLL
jgi:hypothetical protein